MTKARKKNSRKPVLDKKTRSTSQKNYFSTNNLLELKKKYAKWMHYKIKKAQIVYKKIQSKYLLISIDITVAAIFVITVINRSKSLNRNAFWLDEIWRVDLVLNRDLFNTYINNPSAFTAITSPVFAVLIKLITAVLGVSPEAIRLLLLISAMFISLMVYLFMRKHSPILAIIVFSFFILNPEIGYWTLEFKPFVFDSLVIIVAFLAWFNITHCDLRSERKIQGLFVVIVISLLSSIVTVFLLPGIFVTLYLLARTNQLRIVNWKLAVMGSVVLCQTVFMYLVFWRYARSDPGMQSFWSSGFSAYSSDSLLSFYFLSLRDPILSFIHLEDTSLWFFLGCWWLSVVLLVKRFAPETLEKVRIFHLFCFIFFVTLIVSNLLLLWPMGKVRVNLFINVFIVVLICAGSILIGKQGKLRTIRYMNFAVVSCILLSAIHQNSQLEISKPSPTYPQYVLKEFNDNGLIASEIRNLCKSSKSIIVVSPAMYYQVLYYSNYDKFFSPKLKTLSSKCVIQVSMSQFGETHDKDKDQIKNALLGGGKVFWLFSGASELDITRIKDAASLLGRVETLTLVRNKGDGFFKLSS
jgi:hypothetical protein